MGLSHLLCLTHTEQVLGKICKLTVFLHGALFMCDNDEGNMAAAMVQMSCLYRGMLAVRATGIRPLIPGLVPSHFRAFSVKKEKEPELEDNPYYNKYQEKIKKLRK